MSETAKAGDTHAADCQCLCGAVRFSVSKPLREVGMCHCGICRRWAGGAPVVGNVVESVSITAGDSLRWYAASPWGERGFCGACGSSLFWRQKGAGSDWLVCAGALPSADGLELVRHIYIDDKPAYYDFAGDAPRLTGDEFTAKVVATMPPLKRWFVRAAVFFAHLKKRLRPPPPLPDADKRGRCVCGSVRFRLPHAPQEAYLCHCGQCRRWSGGAGVIGITTGVAAVESGDTLRWHKTSERCERGFCGQCGASLFWRSLEAGDIREVCAGALEDGGGLRLREQIYIEEKPAYYDMAGDADQVSGADYARRKRT